MQTCITPIDENSYAYMQLIIDIYFSDWDKLTRVPHWIVVRRGMRDVDGLILSVYFALLLKIPMESYWITIVRTTRLLSVRT